MAKPKNPKKTNDAAQPPNGVEVSGSQPVSPAVAATTAETTSIRANKATKPELTSTPANGKPTIVKGETRSNIVPINIEDEIRQLAYQFSERRGFVPGHENEDWLAAEHEVRERYHQPAQQSA